MIFSKIEWHESSASTNSRLLERAVAGPILEPGFVVAARQQTAGRGRYERKWIAPAGKNLTFSFLLTPHAEPEKMVSLTLATALGVAEALTHFGVQAQTKWPNDVLVTNKKICGILAERADVSSSTAIVVGVGINVNASTDELAAIDRPATSILAETGEETLIETVLERVLESLSTWIDQWQEGGFPILEKAWLERCSGVGEHIRVGESGSAQEGILEGFGQFGQLLLRSDDGTVNEIWAGDVNWREDQ